MLTFRLRTLLSVSLAAALVNAILPRANAQALPSSAPQATAAKENQTASGQNSDLRLQLEQLQQLVRDQQKRIEALEAERQSSARSAAVSAPPASNLTPAPAQASNSSGAPPSPTGPQVVAAGSTDERVRNLEKQIKGLGPISFSGDVRLRAEPFFGGPTDGSLDRARGRVRARFNAVANLGSQFRTGFSLASGDINDPISTNQTLTGFYTRKTIALDQAFVEFTPKEFKHLTLTGGKFRYPWYNTELTWDKDLNPEGAAQTLGFELKNPVLKRVALVGFELPFAEMAGTTATNKRIAQAITYGAQLQTKWQLAPRVSLSAFSGFYDYRGADAIALALARASTKNPQTPFAGLLPLYASNTIQNLISTTTAATIITDTGSNCKTPFAAGQCPTGVTSITNAQFASKFGLFDNLARLDIDTGHARLPVTFIGDYVQNTEACDNLHHIVTAPAGTSAVQYTQSWNFKVACDPRQRRGYWLEGRVGRLQEKGDAQFAYTRIYIEREAVVGNFNYSDIRLGSNVTQHRFEAFYQFDRSVQLGFTALVGRPLASTEPWLTRLELDTVYIF